MITCERIGHVILWPISYPTLHLAIGIDLSLQVRHIIGTRKNDVRQSLAGTQEGWYSYHLATASDRIEW